MYNLTDLAAEVAREKPNGEKNALRKTYKGHIKRLGVAGHFDVAKKPEDAPSDFMALLQVPDFEWDIHFKNGREIEAGLSETTLSTMGRAFTMSKGPIPKSLWDSSVLGDLAPSSGERTKPSSGKPTAPGTPLAATPGASNRPKPHLQPGHDPNRPKRNIKKRSYGDSSFEGYGEGFPDDDGGVDGGYSTGEGEGGQKRRKKVNTLTIIHPLSHLLTCTEWRQCISVPKCHEVRPRNGRRMNVPSFPHRSFDFFPTPFVTPPCEPINGIPRNRGLFYWLTVFTALHGWENGLQLITCTGYVDDT